MAEFDRVQAQSEPVQEEEILRGAGEVRARASASRCCLGGRMKGPVRRFFPEGIRRGGSVRRVRRRRARWRNPEIDDLPILPSGASSTSLEKLRFSTTVFE